MHTYTLTAAGITSPSSHDTLTAATMALCDLLAALPLSAADRETSSVLQTGGPDWVRDFITRDGEFRLEVMLHGQPVEIVIQPR